MSKITPCLWYVNEAEEAANFYVSLLADARVDHVTRNPIDAPGGKAGSVLMVQFTLAGQSFLALNGGIPMEYSNAASLLIDCADQAEIDRLWDGLMAGGGHPEQCGWLRDRWGVPWQITPRVLMGYMTGPDRAKAGRVMAAMMEMVKIDIAALERAAAG